MNDKRTAVQNQGVLTPRETDSLHGDIFKMTGQARAITAGLLTDDNLHSLCSEHTSVLIDMLEGKVQDIEEVNGRLWEKIGPLTQDPRVRQPKKQGIVSANYLLKVIIAQATALLETSQAGGKEQQMFDLMIEIPTLEDIEKELSDTVARIDEKRMNPPTESDCTEEAKS